MRKWKKSEKIYLLTLVCSVMTNKTAKVVK